MRYEDHCSFVFVEGFCDDWEMSEVDMVRRFVEYEESWFFQSEFTEHHESLLPFGECSDRSCHQFTRDQKSARKRTEFLIQYGATRCFEETVIDFL